MWYLLYLHELTYSTKVSLFKLLNLSLISWFNSSNFFSNSSGFKVFDWASKFLIFFAFLQFVFELQLYFSLFIENLLAPLVNFGKYYSKDLLEFLVELY